MKIIPFTRYQLGNIPEALRMLAHQIERGDAGLSTIRCVVTLEGSDGLLDYRAFGEDFTRAHAAGLCQAAAVHILSGTFREPE